MSHPCPLPRQLVVVLGALIVVGTVEAQNPRRGSTTPGIYQMDLYNGPTRTVHYAGVNMSPGEESTVKELARLENESAYAQSLLALKRQYVNSERRLEPYRAVVQQDLYGRSVSVSDFSFGNGGYGYGGYGYGYGGYAYPYYRSGYGLGYPGGAGFGGSSSLMLSLANGVGDEGVLKNNLAKTIAEQANPTYAATMDAGYGRAVAAAASLPRVRLAMGLPTPEAMRKERNGISLADAELSPASGYTLYLNSGATIRGNNLRLDKGFYLIDRIGGGTTQIRESQVDRIDTGASNKIVPAAK